ncbi:unnamed protein product [Effrenium voratum]|nr:unnamed protein product [Effrenium voratum]
MPSSVATWNANLLVSHQEYLAKLELIGKRLQTHLRTLKWPPTTHFEAEGVRYALPLQCQEQLLPMLLEEKQEYLASFFDGDGCAAAQVLTSSSHALLRSNSEINKGNQHGPEMFLRLGPRVVGVLSAALMETEEALQASALDALELGLRTSELSALGVSALVPQLQECQSSDDVVLHKARLLLKTFPALGAASVTPM